MSYNIIADSSFYLCYLDDIDNCDALNRIIDYFDFYLTNIIKSEISRNHNYKNIECNENLKHFESPFDIKIILEPFFSKQEKIDGEHELMAISFLLDFFDIKHYTIIDDNPARKFVEINIPKIVKYMKRTARFTTDCYIKYPIFSKEEALSLLDCIDKSKFRIKSQDINALKREIEVN